MKILTSSKHNARCFEVSEQSILDIKSFFFHTLLEWSLVLPSCTSFSLHALLFPSMFFLIIVIWVTNFCHCSTFPVDLGWLFFSKNLLRYLSKKKKKILTNSKSLIQKGKKSAECTQYSFYKCLIPKSIQVSKSYYISQRLWPSNQHSKFPNASSTPSSSDPCVP